MYPSFIIKYKFVPPHLNKDIFVKIYEDQYNQRIAAKRAGRMLESETKKLLLNSVTGNYQNEHSWLYSTYAVMQIRMNGQLVLLMLCERLMELGATIIQINTDGVLYRIKKAKYDELQTVIKDFEELTQLGFETDAFDSFYQLAVNDYFGLQSNGKIKEKGSFITKVRRGKGLTPTIIPKAVIKYFLEGIKPQDYIKSCTDIKEFLMSEKTGKQWNVEYNNIPQQRTNRFYASTDGHFLYKWKYTGHKEGEITNGPWGEKIVHSEKQYQNMLTASGVTLLNNFDDLKEDPKINYRYYITEANKIIAQFKNKQLSLF